jgi:hypothetical protein
MFHIRIPYGEPTRKIRAAQLSTIALTLRGRAGATSCEGVHPRLTSLPPPRPSAFCPLLPFRPSSTSFSSIRVLTFDLTLCFPSPRCGQANLSSFPIPPPSGHAFPLALRRFTPASPLLAQRIPFRATLFSHPLRPRIWRRPPFRVRRGRRLRPAALEAVARPGTADLLRRNRTTTAGVFRFRPIRPILATIWREAHSCRGAGRPQIGFAPTGPCLLASSRLKSGRAAT